MEWDNKSLEELESFGAFGAFGESEFGDLADLADFDLSMPSLLVEGKKPLMSYNTQTIIDAVDKWLYTYNLDVNDPEFILEDKYKKYKEIIDILLDISKPIDPMVYKPENHILNPGHIIYILIVRKNKYRLLNYRNKIIKKKSELLTNIMIDLSYSSVEDLQRISDAHGRDDIVRKKYVKDTMKEMGVPSVISQLISTYMPIEMNDKYKIMDYADPHVKDNILKKLKYKVYRLPIITDINRQEFIEGIESGMIGQSEGRDMFKK